MDFLRADSLSGLPFWLPHTDGSRSSGAAPDRCADTLLWAIAPLPDSKQRAVVLAATGIS
jgi:hypothetical protein